MPPIVNDPVAWSVGLSVCLSPIVSPAENTEAIEIPFAFKTRVGPGKTYNYIQRIAWGEHCIVFIQHNTAF